MQAEVEVLVRPLRVPVAVVAAVRQSYLALRPVARLIEAAVAAVQAVPAVQVGLAL